MELRKDTGANWKISVDGIERTNRDVRDYAFEAAARLKRRHPNSVITVTDRTTGEATVVTEPSPPDGLAR